MEICFDWNTLKGKRLCFSCKFWSGDMIDKWERKDDMLVARRMCMNPFRIGVPRSSHHPACVFFRERRNIEPCCRFTKNENGEVVMYKVIELENDDCINIV